MPQVQLHEGLLDFCQHILYFDAGSAHKLISQLYDLKDAVAETGFLLVICRTGEGRRSQGQAFLV